MFIKQNVRALHHVIAPSQKRYGDFTSIFCFRLRMSVGAAPTKDVSAQVEDHIEPEKFIALCMAARPHLSTGYIAAFCCTNNSQRSQNKE